MALKTWPTHLKSENFKRLYICMWGVYPEAMAWNVGGLHSDLNLGERIWSNGTQRADFIVHFGIGPLWAIFPDTLTKIEI